jgi:hypothetical protein
MPERPPTARELGNATAVHYVGLLRGSLISLCALVLALRAGAIADVVLRVFAWIGCAAFVALGAYLVRRSLRRLRELRSIREQAR